MNRILTGLVVALIVIGTACGGGSGGGVIEQGFSAGFTAAEPTPGQDTIAAAENGSSGALVTVAITLTDTSGVYGADFDLSYDADMADWVGSSAGSLLEQGGQTPFYDVQEPTPGQLVVVATRQGAVPGADATGTVTIIELTFAVEEVGSSSISYQANIVWDDQLPPQPISGISWFGGSLDAI